VSGANNHPITLCHPATIVMVDPVEVGEVCNFGRL
jgi:hypothetical protein